RLYRAAKNNEALGRMNPRLGPGWAIGGWLIPIANLVIPFIIMDDVWRGADPSIPRGDPSWRRSSTLAAIWAWLVTAVIFTLPSGIASSGGEVRADRPDKGPRGGDPRIGRAVGATAAGGCAVASCRPHAARPAR